MRRSEDNRESDERLCDGSAEARISLARTQFEWFEVFVLIAICVAAHLGPEIDGVRDQEEPPKPRFDRKCNKPQACFHNEDEQKPALMAPQMPIAVAQRGWTQSAGCTHQAHYRLRDRAEHERSAQCGTDANTFAGLGLTKYHGNEGDNAFGQRCAERGEDRTDGLRAMRALRPTHSTPLMKNSQAR